MTVGAANSAQEKHLIIESARHSLTHSIHCHNLIRLPHHPSAGFFCPNLSDILHGQATSQLLTIVAIP